MIKMTHQEATDEAISNMAELFARATARIDEAYDEYLRKITITENGE